MSSSVRYHLSEPSELTASIAYFDPASESREQRRLRLKAAAKPLVVTTNGKGAENGTKEEINGAKETSGTEEPANGVHEESNAAQQEANGTSEKAKEENAIDTPA